MKTWLGLIILTLACTACEAPVTSTFVNGTVNGISIPGANAVSVTDTDILGGTRRTVWVGTGLVCSDLGKPSPVPHFGPSPIELPDGGHGQLLIVVQNGSSYLDTAVGTERIAGTTSQFTLLDSTNNTLTGRFTSTFVPLPDGGGVSDAGSFSGDFIAPPCAAANAGCEVTPVGSFGLLALVLLRLRRAVKPDVRR